MLFPIFSCNRQLKEQFLFLISVHFCYYLIIYLLRRPNVIILSIFLILISVFLLRMKIYKETGYTL